MCVYIYLQREKNIYFICILPLHINIICNYTRNDKLELDTCIFIITKLNINN